VGLVIKAYKYAAESLAFPTAALRTRRSSESCRRALTVDIYAFDDKFG
jgi:hypothetical protein